MYILTSKQMYDAECNAVKRGETFSSLMENAGKKCADMKDNDIKNILPKRKRDSNKGTYGHALCVCGSRNMTGCAYLSAMGAYRAGCGLVTLAFPDAAYNALMPKLVEPIALPLKSNSEGTLSKESANEIIAYSNKVNAILIGCGIGNNEDTKSVIENIIKNSNKPIIIDADGLNAISQNPDILKKAKVPVIITPHPGEMSRLTGKSIDEILSDTVNCAADFSNKYNCITVLKTANTVVASPIDSRVYVNDKGSSGLSKGGSGDLLAGIIVSLISQGMNPFEAAVAGVYIHSDAADYVLKNSSQRGMLPSDILNALPSYLSKFE